MRRTEYICDICGAVFTDHVELREPALRLYENEDDLTWDTLTTGIDMCDSCFDEYRSHLMSFNDKLIKELKRTRGKKE